MSEFNQRYVEMMTARAIWERARAGSKSEVQKFAKWEKCAERALEAAENFDDAEEVYLSSPWRCRVEEAALQKMCEFLRRAKYAR